MTVRKILELIDLVKEQIGVENYLTKLQDYQTTIQNNSSNIVLLKEILEKIDVSKTTPTITLGSYVKVNTMQLFISAALPKISLEGVTILSVSPQSPLGNQLIGKKQHDTVVVNGNSFTIHEIL